jgi:5'-3' exonuclease
MIVIDYSGVSITQIMGALQGDNTAKIDIDGFRNLMLWNIVETRKKYFERFGEIAFAVDNEKYWRKAMFPDYKCYRKKEKEDQGYDWDMIHAVMDEFKQDLINFFPYPVIEGPFAEADDVVGTMAEYSQTHDVVEDMFGTSEPKPFLIIASDTDMAQCQKYKNVKQMSPYTKEQVVPVLEKSKVKVRVPLQEFILDHILTGDAGDSIPNILTPDNFFRVKLENTDPDAKFRQKSVTAGIKEYYQNQWAEHGEIKEFRTPEEEKNFKRNMRLIHFDLIPQRVKDGVIKSYESQLGKDRSQLLTYFTKNKLRNLMDEREHF